MTTMTNDAEKTMPLIMGMSVLLTCQLLGELISRAIALPVPGPVIGMVLLLLGLMIRGEVPSGLRLMGEGLLRYLTLLFVPAGVGLIVHGAMIGRNAVAILAILLVSTAMTLALTAWVLAFWQRRSGQRATREADR